MSTTKQHFFFTNSIDLKPNSPVTNICTSSGDDYAYQTGRDTSNTALLLLGGSQFHLQRFRHLWWRRAWQTEVDLH